MVICGLDLSITSSGVVVMTLNDVTLDIEDVKCYGFTTAKKYEAPNIIYYSPDWFRGRKYQKYSFIREHIMEWTKDVSVFGVEDYSKNLSSVGRIIDLGECEGYLKLSLFDAGKAMFAPAIKQIKKFYTGSGDSNKVAMYKQFKADTDPKPDISCLPEVTSGDGNPPTSDIIDAYAIAKMLIYHMKLNKGIIDISKEPKHLKEVFTTKSEEKPNGLIAVEYVRKLPLSVVQEVIIPPKKRKKDAKSKKK